LKATIKERQVGDVIIQDLYGDYRLDEGTAQLCIIIKSLRCLLIGPKILLNCERLNRADASLRGILLIEQALLISQCGQLKLLRPSERLQNVLGIGKLGLHSVFDFRHKNGKKNGKPYNSEAEAIRSFCSFR
jgi:hypothetical protein